MSTVQNLEVIFVKFIIDSLGNKIFDDDDDDDDDSNNNNNNIPNNKQVAVEKGCAMKVVCGFCLELVNCYTFISAFYIPLEFYAS